MTQKVFKQFTNSYFSRSHDARILEELDKFRIQMGNGTNLSNLQIPNLIIDLPTYVDGKFKLA